MAQSNQILGNFRNSSIVLFAKKSKICTQTKIEVEDEEMVLQCIEINRDSYSPVVDEKPLHSPVLDEKGSAE